AMQPTDLDGHQRISVRNQKEQRRRDCDGQQLIDGKGTMSCQYATAPDARGQLVPAQVHRPMDGIAMRADEKLPCAGHALPFRHGCRVRPRWSRPTSARAASLKSFSGSMLSPTLIRSRNSRTDLLGEK